MNQAWSSTSNGLLIIDDVAHIPSAGLGSLWDLITSQKLQNTVVKLVKVGDLSTYKYLRIDDYSSQTGYEIFTVENIDTAGSPSNDDQFLLEIALAGPQGIPGATGNSGPIGPTGATGNTALTIYGPTGIVASGVSSFGLTGSAVTSVTNIGGVDYFNLSGGGGGSNSYAVRFDYDTSSQLTSSAQATILTASPWTSVGLNVTVTSTINVSFNFSNETTPPRNVIGYFYNANADQYAVSTFGLGNNQYVITNVLGSTITSSIATNTFFSSFGSHNLVFDLTPTNYGGSKKNLPPVFIHAYLVFIF